FDFELCLVEFRLPHEPRIGRYPYPFRRNAEEIGIKLVIPILIMDGGNGIDAVFEALERNDHLTIGDYRFVLADWMPFGAVGECFPVRAFRRKHAQKNLTLVASEVVDRDCQVSGK
ncbi:MAG TPA: hypothetical protein VNR65_17920, partial [Geobacterales bacterium]|nr:hypothetical protein [Geobacterales bacterium]